AQKPPFFVKNDFRGSVAVIHDISEIQRLNNELEATRRMLKKERAKYTFEDIVSDSEEMKNVIKQATKISQTKVNVLITGEYGVGKEVLAQAIHNNSERKNNTYVRVNLLMIPKEKQIETFFGEKSVIARSDNGTLLIENVHAASEDLQEKFLKLLKDNEFESEFFDYKPDVRFIFTTTEDLKTLVSVGKFSQEIFYKISVVNIKIPSLRERKDDIPKLAKQILHNLNQKYGRIIYDFTEDAMEKLLKYNWNGNIRELENVIDRAILNLGNQDRIITSTYIPEIVESSDKHMGTLKEMIEDQEKKIIIEMLEVCHGNKTEAAKKLGLTVRNLYYKLDRYGIK
ncbi:MAG TPA: sigma 54-interacting transcriptional regulator, partial [Tepiditoga sp.]|nr:sigma 54-interacting transcriptional regulator [Tepiditoga sp.]